MITSISNEKIKHVRLLLEKAKVRRKEKLFVAEGLRMVTETPVDLLEQVFVSEHFLEEHAEDASYVNFMERVRSHEIFWEEVSDPVMKFMSDTVTPQGIMAVIRQPEYSLEGILANNVPLLLLLENVQDPGNLGTMFRTAEGAGVSGIIMSRDMVDVFSPKVIRSTMGSIYRVPWIVTEDLRKTMADLKERGISIYAAYLGADKFYDMYDYRDASAFIIGNEGQGLTPETAALADHKILIPMAGQVESLNAAMSAGILMYEAARQRRNGVL